MRNKKKKKHLPILYSTVQIILKICLKKLINIKLMGTLQNIGMQGRFTFC